MANLVFVIDCYLYVPAQTKEEADAIVEKTDELLAAQGLGLCLFEAYGIEDADTGAELRPVH